MNTNMKKPIRMWMAGAVVALSGCQSLPGGAGAPDLQEVEAIERARLAAWMRADTQAMRSVLGDDLLYCHSDGRCENKEQIVSSIGSGKQVYRSIEVLELKPRAVGGAVLINGRVRLGVDSNGKQMEFNAIFTDVYVRRDGRWQMVSYQSTSTS